MTDPIADLLTRIRNGQMARKTSVSVPSSKLKAEMLQVLKNVGFIQNFKKETLGGFDQLRVDLDPTRTLTLTRKSKPGQRIYIAKGDIKKVLNGYGVSLISTSKGVLTGDDARKEGVGGELLCEIY